MPANTYTLIEKIVIGATSAERITFTSIPQGYTDLKIVASVRSESPNPYDFIYGYVNGVSGIHYPGRRLRGDGSSASSATSNVGYFDLQYVNGDGATASAFGNLEIYFPNYSGSNQKSFSIDSVTETNSTTAYAHMWSYNYTNGTSAITSIVLASGSGYFKQYSSFYLYGIAKEGVSPSPSSAPYATGGDSIVFDGTYWIHTFRSSGTFTPKKSLTCDYLVVAGGGGAGGANTNGGTGGGGAGGLRCTVTATGGGGSLESALSLAANTGYTVTIGAGGAGNTSGSNSVFSSITSTGGGGGSEATGATGGSGGGSGASYGASTGTANQGYAGGTAIGSSGGSGGGGAGAVGAAASTSGGGLNGGAGGNGVATSISGTSTTYAGGGGGSSHNSAGATSGAGGTGGGGTGSTTVAAATNGTANTGGGGGGARTGAGQTRGTGGSGIVIVRYAA